jgi:hypothetical protein
MLIPRLKCAAEGESGRDGSCRIHIGANRVAHRPVATLALVPHANQGWVTGVDEVDDPHIGLAGVLSMQPASVLLQRSLPRDGHRQDQGIEGRMVESFADELAGGEQNTRRIGWQRIEFFDERGALLPGHPSVKNETWRRLCTQCHLDGVEVLGALGQDQQLAALIECFADFCGDRRCPRPIVREVPKHLLNARLRRQIDSSKA